ncbi:DUF6892 domain-containing protein [Lentzea sp. JNUCC 0626]|uniref:DUF6892 domain-containing protein n=1 Tax=Lentzea sp. JNUCC 0626 TaxID=3367513 RepID=UPI003747B68C
MPFGSARSVFGESAERQFCPYGPKPVLTAAAVRALTGYSDRSQLIPFADAKFKLAVVPELTYNQELLPKFKLGEYAAEQGFTYDDGSFEAVPEALAYYAALEVPVELAEKITEIYMDGGNEIYLEIAPNWDGEGGLFDVDEFAEVRHFPNLSR